MKSRITAKLCCEIVSSENCPKCTQKLKNRNPATVSYALDAFLQIEN